MDVPKVVLSQLAIRRAVRDGGVRHVLRRFRTNGSYRGECEDQVKGFPASKHKKFRVREEAEAWLRENGIQITSTPAAQPSVTSSSQPLSSTRVDSGSETVRQQARRSASPARRNQTPLAREKSTDILAPRTVYCDGACRGNGKADSIAGVGVYWGAGDPR